jgi:hypothetical protein
MVCSIMFHPQDDSQKGQPLKELGLRQTRQVSSFHVDNLSM